MPFEFENNDEVRGTPLFWDNEHRHWVKRLPIYMGYDPVNNRFYAEASDMRLQDIPVQLMFQFGHDEYLFQFSEVIHEGEDVIAYEYIGVEHDARLHIFND